MGSVFLPRVKGLIYNSGHFKVTFDVKCDDDCLPELEAFCGNGFDCGRVGKDDDVQHFLLTVQT